MRKISEPLDFDSMSGEAMAAHHRLVASDAIEDLLSKLEESWKADGLIVLDFVEQRARKDLMGYLRNLTAEMCHYNSLLPNGAFLRSPLAPAKRGDHDGGR